MSPTGLEPGALFSHLDLTSRRSVVVGVSGGGDSLALLCLFKSFLNANAPHVRLVAATVDHGLRQESATEAKIVAGFCALRNIAHKTLTWGGSKPGTGLIAAARDARHALLAAAAAEAGTDLVLIGHTRDDQAETVAMRLKRSDDGDGLAGMAPATLHRGSVWFCRPLLGVTRIALRDYLTHIGVAWIDDPSNENPAFERVRVRTSMTDAQRERHLEHADHTARRRSALSGEAATLIERFADEPAPGLLQIDPAMLCLTTVPTISRDAIVLAIRAVVATAGGMPHLPDRSRVEALADRLGRGPLRATLSRAVIDARKSGIWMRREARSFPELSIGPRAAMWDGRWAISASEGGTELRVAPQGIVASGSEPLERDAVPQSLARAAFSAEPWIFANGLAVGHAAGDAARSLGVTATRLVAPHAAYLPSFDLDLAGALRRLYRLPVLPAPPWKNHIATGA